MILNTSQSKISEYYDVINQQNRKKRENKTNPNKIKYRQKSKRCTIKKRNHHSTKAHKHTAKDLLNMTKLESRKEREIMLVNMGREH